MDGPPGYPQPPPPGGYAQPYPGQFAYSGPPGYPQPYPQPAYSGAPLTPNLDSPHPVSPRSKSPATKPEKSKKDPKPLPTPMVSPSSAYGEGGHAGLVLGDSQVNVYLESLSKPLDSPFHENLKVLKTFTSSDGTIVTIEEYVAMRGVYQNWIEAYYRGLAGHFVKRVHIELKNTEIKVESGAVHLMKGQLELDAKMTLSTSIQGSIRPKISGNGHLWMEPSYQYYAKIDIDGEIVIEQGYFWACQGSILAKAKKISAKASVVGESSVFHTKLTGKGWIIMRLPVPECEVQKFQLNDEKLVVDHHKSVIWRSKGVSFSAEFAGKTGFQKAMNTSGEGVFRTYKGTGEVWVMPTLIAYHNYQLIQNLPPHLQKTMMIQ